MATISFDTLKFSNRLKAAGVPGKQAEAEPEALAEAFEVNLKELATKTDLQHMEGRFEHKLALLEQRMVIKLGALMVVAVGAVATLVKLL
jgi:hypothetical protein